MANKVKVVHIFVHPSFYQKLDNARANYSRSNNLSKDISFNKFTEYLGKNCQFNLNTYGKKINTRLVSKLKTQRKTYGTKKR